MNNFDKTLFSFFLDYDGIMGGYMSDKFSKEWKERTDLILKNKVISDINVQDKDGNTFAHYALANCGNNFTYIFKLLSLGANPMIRNNKNQNVFMYTKDNIYRFWEEALKGVVKEGFSNFTKKWNIDAKQSMLREGIDKGRLYLDKYDAIDLLETEGLMNKKNFLDLTKFNIVEDFSVIEYANNNFELTGADVNNFLQRILFNNADELEKRLSDETILTIKKCIEKVELDYDGLTLSKIAYYGRLKKYGFVSQLFEVLLNDVVENHEKIFVDSKKLVEFEEKLMQSPSAFAYYETKMMGKPKVSLTSVKMKI